MKPALRITALVLALCVLLSFPGVAQQTAEQSTHGIQVQNIDRSAKPGDDFYQYANGEYLKRTEIPPDRAAVGVFNKLADLANKRTADLIEEIAKSNPAAGSETRKIADLFNSYMNEDAIEKRALQPLRPHLDAIKAIKDKKDLARALGESLRDDVDPLNNTNYHTANLFGIWVAPGFEDYEHYNAYLLQGGLVLPDREYYVSNSEHMKDVRASYQKHVAALMKLAGFDDADARAAHVVELEHAIAE
ncbi:MAG TPA: M13 family metallopeptidase N-terminal domain-containing protein, partial [Terriglobales bacterium]